MGVRLPFRQVHLDFHTSEQVPAVGDRFDPDTFAETFERARVNSVTVFARCHHGWLYYDSKQHPERVHPKLVRPNLLWEEVEALHKRGIRAPIYTTVQWDHYSASRHPEWLTVAPDGRPQAMVESMPHQAGFYRFLCLNSPYRDFLKAHVADIIASGPCDGIFLDILWPVDCSCMHCEAAMRAEGLRPADAAARMDFARRTLAGFMREMTAWIHQHAPGCSVYYNSGGIGPGRREGLEAFTHLEFDALPSDSPDGYMNFPRRVRFDRTLGLDAVGHTGKFHRGWGDIHSFKNHAALEFDCFQLLALGVKCLVGDQMDPSGLPCPHTYENVGAVYRQVEACEPWCEGATPRVDIGVLATTSREAQVGVTRMLQEGGHQFDFLDAQSDLSRYRLVILPDRVPAEEPLLAALRDYLAAGGALLASFESAMNPAKDAFLLEELGVTVSGPGPLDADGAPVRGRVLGWKQADYVDYLRPEGALGQGLPPTEHAMYTQAVQVAPAADAEELLPVILPYFDRTADHFFSHMHAPSSGQRGGAGVVRRGRVIYFAHAIFELYHQFGARWYKQLVLNAIDQLLPDTLLRHNGPTTLMATVNEQPERARTVVHLLHYIPERRSEYVTVLEDVIPLFNLTVSVRMDQPPAAVTLEPQSTPLPFAHANGRVEFTVPRLNGRQLICIR